MEESNATGGITALIMLAIFFAPMIFAWLSKRKCKSAEKELAQALDDLRRSEQARRELEEKYKPVVDIEYHVKSVLEEAEGDAESMRINAKALLFQAKEKHAKAKEKSELMELSARKEAEKIIDFANRQAKEIAGSALDAKDQADFYEATVKAMKNTIDGYHDDYIIPNHSVLDDLAEEFSHKDAGEELKQARKRVREFVKNGYAGDCEYAEANRRLYAIHFAVDAFNGKVDSALAKVKSDNYGKIKQEILDAFALVNFNGKAFRNAHIRQEYLDARLEELQWAVTVHELKKIEREEQREIREKMREEEKARKEMEKAVKEAEKEEKMLQKALDAARKELAAAHGEQREQYETQLAELEDKLKEAEAKGERAISMAQQTRRGHVYVISNIGSFGENVFKIGMTRRLEPNDRVKELGDASVPFEFDVHAMIYSDDAPALEKELHQRFNLHSVNKVNPRKEFFNLSLAEIKLFVEQSGMDEVHWTMKAEALEYRESLNIAEMQKEEAVA